MIVNANFCDCTWFMDNTKTVFMEQNDDNVHISR